MREIPKGFTVVSDPSKLSASGTRRFTPFFVGDTVKIGDKAYSTEFTDKKGEKHTVYYLDCDVNDRAKMVTFSSFRRFPKDENGVLENALRDYPVLRSLFDGSDAERFEFLKNKTLRVAEVRDGQFLDFEKSNLESKEYHYKQGKFPCFEVVE